VVNTSAPGVDVDDVAALVGADVEDVEDGLLPAAFTPDVWTGLGTGRFVAAVCIPGVHPYSFKLGYEYLFVYLVVNVDLLTYWHLHK
jgi:hypothetical protein